MSEEKKNRMIGVRLDDETLKRLDFLAEKIGIPRSRMASRMIEAALPDVKILDNIGLLRWGSYLDYVIRTVREHVKIFGKPTPEQRNTPVTIWLSEEDIETLDTVGKKFLLNKTRFASNIITAFAPEMAFIAKWGAVEVVQFIEGMKDTVKDKSFAKLKQKGIKH